MFSDDQQNRVEVLMGVGYIFSLMINKIGLKYYWGGLYLFSDDRVEVLLGLVCFCSLKINRIGLKY